LSTQIFGIPVLQYSSPLPRLHQPQPQYQNFLLHPGYHKRLSNTDKNINDRALFCGFNLGPIRLFEVAVMTLLQVIETTIALALLATVGEAIRRLYFHPLAHIPGPKLAALTWWYEFYFDQIQRSRYVFQVQELHKQYGRCLMQPRLNCSIGTSMIARYSMTDHWISA
jgi:hypothetical protein